MIKLIRKVRSAFRQSDRTPKFKKMKYSHTFFLFPVLVILMIISYKVFPQTPTLKAGIAKVDITPTENLYMGGYDESCRMGPSEGHSGNIYVRALVFDDDIIQMAFIELDVVSLPSSDYDPLRKKISQETGIPFHHIMIACVHNHAAPYPGGKNVDSEWYKNLDSRIINAVNDAISDLEPVKIGGGTGFSAIAMNRRKKMSNTLSYRTFDENNSSQSYGKYKTDNPVKIREMEGVYRLGANPSGPIDAEVGIIRIDNLAGQPIAAFINYACHGTSLGGRNNIISPEWNGHMLEYIEQQYAGLIGIFAQGAAGDINPRFVGGLEGCADNLENTKNLGYEIGKEVVRVFNSIETGIPESSKIKFTHENVVCPKKYGEVVEDFKNTTIEVPITALKIDEFTWVTFPGELFHEIGQKVKSSTHSKYSFIVGYCNGSLGYLPTQIAYSEGGYEPWATKFAPVTEKILVAGIENMLIQLY